MNLLTNEGATLRNVVVAVLYIGKYAEEYWKKYKVKSDLVKDGGSRVKEQAAFLCAGVLV